MALVNCPECNYEGVSDTADRCPKCGYNVAKHFERLNQKKTTKNISIGINKIVSIIAIVSILITLGICFIIYQNYYRTPEKLISKITYSSSEADIVKLFVKPDSYDYSYSDNSHLIIYNNIDYLQNDWIALITLT